MDKEISNIKQALDSEESWVLSMVCDINEAFLLFAVNPSGVWIHTEIWILPLLNWLSY